MSLFPQKESQLGQEISFRRHCDDNNAAIDLGHFLYEQLVLLNPSLDDIVILCIGTDRSTGDCLGPLVGSRFLEMHSSLVRCSVLGTLEHPVHATNLNEIIAQLEQKPVHPCVIAIDACLGRLENVGLVNIGIGPIKPGAGVKKELPPIGNLHLTGIVNVGGFMEYFVLQNTRLSMVMKMADLIVESLTFALKKYSKKPPLSI